MSVTITGKLVDVTFSASHMAFVLDDGGGTGELMKLIDNSVREDQKRRWMNDGVIKEMISIPYGTAVTILGSSVPSSDPTIAGGDLIMRVRASEALVWNSVNRQWRCDHSVETVIKMKNFDGNI